MCQLANLLTREGALNFLFAHVDGAVTSNASVARAEAASWVWGRPRDRHPLRIGAQPAGGRELGSRVLQDVGENAVGRTGNTRALAASSLNGDRVTACVRGCARRRPNSEVTAVDLVDRLGEGGVHQRGTT